MLRRLLLLAVLFLPACVAARAQLLPPKKFGLPLDGLTPVQLAQFERGRSKFSRQFTPQTGLGPLYNDNSCRACHGQGGSGGPSERTVHLAGAMIDGGPSLLEKYGGPAIQDFAVAGTKIEQVPKLATALGVRISPQTWGAGLLETIPERDLLVQMAPNKDKFALGIRGIANWQNGKIGRFGWKAQKPDMKIFTEQAYDWEMGISTPDRGLEQVPNGAPRKVKKADISTEEEMDVVTYERLQDGPPRGPMLEGAAHGEELFNGTGCAFCHNPTQTTGANTVGVPAGRVFHPYTDLLLHLMDEDLSDQMTQDAATGQMWRTAPLWGLRVRKKYMHDGRSTELDDAIMLHGGEAEKVRDRYAALQPEEKAALRAFLNTL